jgi:hypothetical protein
LLPLTVGRTGINASTSSIDGRDVHKGGHHAVGRQGCVFVEGVDSCYAGGHHYIPNTDERILILGRRS